MTKGDFPIFKNNPGLIYLDSAASAQKPALVIDGIKHYLENDYANIHRGQYELSQRSEELFWQSRKIVAEWMSVDPAEIVFTNNATSASNLLVQSLGISGYLRKGDTIWLCEADHHANIIPWQMAAEQHECTIAWIPVDNDGVISLDWITENYDKTVRIVAITAVSNVTGTIMPVEKIGALLANKPETYFVVDASQAIPHMKVNPTERGADFCRRTGHKIGALPGIGILRGKKSLLDALNPALGGGGSIDVVTKSGYALLGSPDKFEPGTPNLTGVISLKLALEYLRAWSVEYGGDGSVDGVYKVIEAVERPLVEYCVKQFALLNDKYGLSLLGKPMIQGRIGVFSFVLGSDTVNQTISSLGQVLGKQQICIRCGGQCAQPYHETIGAHHGSCRMSLWIYNDLKDCEVFFSEVDKFLGSL